MFVDYVAQCNLVSVLLAISDPDLKFVDGKV